MQLEELLSQSSENQRRKFSFCIRICEWKNTRRISSTDLFDADSLIKKLIFTIRALTPASVRWTHLFK